MSINDIIRAPEKLACDKRIHMLVGVLLTSVLVVMGVNVGLTVVIVSTIGILVEVYQLKSGAGAYDVMDALAVLIGSILVAVPVWVVT